MTIDHAKELNRLCADGLWMAAGTRICQILETDHVVSNNAEGLKVVQDLLQHLLDSEMYLEAATLQWGPEQFNTEPESTVRVFKAMQEGSTVLLMGASSMSKCLHPDTPVIMFDGSVKIAKEVKVGDQLMGDDSTPRKVLVANPGFGPMYRITPERGEPWECNDAHILSLRVSAHKKCGSGCLSKKWRKGDVIDIPIKEYLELSKDKKNLLKQFHVGVEFEEKPLPFDPYIYGAWIGDGGFDVPALHTPDGPMAKRWVEYFQALGYRIWSGYHDKCPMWAARWPENGKNPFLDFIRTSRINGEKTILNDYLVNSRENRLKLLAGLIDSDGWVSCKTSYQFVTKHEALANQVMRLARSLGYASTVTPRVHRIKSIGFSGTYFHVGISGVGITEIPTLEKHALEPKTKKNLCNTGFKVEPIGDGKYYGFVIDGNHRFLLGDFTVTHNTYAAGAYMLLDYLRDPFYTTVKLAAVNEDHLRKNLFAHVVNLYRSCAIPSAYEITVQDSTLWMGVKAAGYGFGISGIAFKQSQETSGQFKGYKAQPVRKKKHEKFGYLSRLRVLGDEGQNWPNGPFKDFNSLIASKSGTELIKIAVAFNPESSSVHVVQLAEPEHGWSVDDMDRLYDWSSKAGWRVCRLDAALSENVKQRVVVYPGLQTYEGFISYLKAGGDNSPNYSCFARGWPPMKGDVNTIIPPQWPQEARGEATFIENPEVFASVDLAFMGKDSAQMAIGRWGLASGWEDHMGRFQPFKDRLNSAKDKPRHVLQIDQLIPLEKHDNTVKMAEEIMGRCKMLQIDPDHVAVDKTGYGFGTWSHLCKVWGEVLGIAWNEKASELKILAEDQNGADKQCDGLMSEMWWAFRRWLDPSCRAILINPIIPPQPLHTQLTSRRYRTGAKGIKVEAKEEYKSRNQNSPDEADAVIMLVHMIRQTSDVIPGLVEHQINRPESGPSNIKLYSMKGYVNVEADDSISIDGADES